MKHRIRAAAILLNDNNQILLVKHRDHNGEWWVPPGGGFEDSDKSTLDTVKREVMEETGLEIEVGPLIYVREFSEISTQTHHIELFYLASGYEGSETLENLHGLGGDEFLIEEIRWYSKEQMKGAIVYPEELKSCFWEHVSKDITQAKYLGVHVEPQI